MASNDEIGDRGRTHVSYLITHKSDVLDAWKQYLDEEVHARGYTVKYFRSDNGGEYTVELADAITAQDEMHERYERTYSSLSLRSSGSRPELSSTL